MTGADLPSLVSAIPGPASQGWVDRLALVECPAITSRRARRAAALGVASDDPIVWDEAVGSNVRDADGNVFVDLTAGFGVAGAGHRNPVVVAAGQAQLGRLVHAMGDAFPDPNRVRLMERLCEMTGMDRVILGSSGSDAVEAALKTARLATGRDGVLCFEGAYHGLSYGALSVIGYKEADFRGPFSGQMGGHVRRAPYGEALPEPEALRQVGAVIVEPIQGRGGMRAAPHDWLEALARRTREAGALLIFDEIYSGFHRTGRPFAFHHSGVRPDLLCVGKSLADGFPISACLGTAAAMDAWGASKGEALHTQTFLGHPVGCAMALATLDELDRLGPEVEEKSAWLMGNLNRHGLPARGLGLMVGATVPKPLAVSRGLLQRGYLALPAGDRNPVLAITPPLSISLGQLEGALRALLDTIDEVQR